MPLITVNVDDVVAKTFEKQEDYINELRKEIENLKIDLKLKEAQESTMLNIGYEKGVLDGQLTSYKELAVNWTDPNFQEPLTKGHKCCEYVVKHLHGCIQSKIRELEKTVDFIH
jgi:hypothetical protein